VRQVAEISAEKLGVDLKIQRDARDEFLEDEYLVLDSNKAESVLGWDNRIEGVEAISMSLVPSGGFSQGNIIADVEEFLSRPSR
jgi:nucleoside-diphosphate-sugar epimerase